MSNLRLAALGWITPVVTLALLQLILFLGRTAPFPEPEGDPPPCYVNEQGDMICPEAPMAPESALRRVANVLASERFLFPLAAVGLVTGLSLSTAAVLRARKNPEEKLAFRVGLAALLLLIVIPAGLGLFALIIVASFPVRG